jgi:hypothetical protein
LEASLITQTSSCILLSCQTEETPIVKKFGNSEIRDFEFNPLTTEEINKAIELCSQKMDFFPFTYLKVIEDNGISSLILLKRHKPSMCNICNRIHEHENPYLVIHGEEKHLYFDCRRNIENKKTYVGSLGINSHKPPSPVIETKMIKSKQVNIIKVPEPVASFNPLDFIKSASSMKSDKKESKKIIDIPNRDFNIKFKL